MGWTRVKPMTEDMSDLEALRALFARTGIVATEDDLNLDQGADAAIVLEVAEGAGPRAHLVILCISERGPPHARERPRSLPRHPH